jgi:hypothetical protein
MTIQHCEESPQAHVGMTAHHLFANTKGFKDISGLFTNLYTPLKSYNIVLYFLYEVRRLPKYGTTHGLSVCVCLARMHTTQTGIFDLCIDTSLPTHLSSSIDVHMKYSLQHHSAVEMSVI